MRWRERASGLAVLGVGLALHGCTRFGFGASAAPPADAGGRELAAPGDTTGERSADLDRADGVIASPDAGPPPDRGPAPDALPGPPVATLSDNFDDGSIDPALWQLDGVCGTMAKAGGVVVMSIAKGGPQREFCFLKTVALYDLRNGSFILKVPLVCTPQALGLQTILRFDAGDRAYFAFVENGGFSLLVETPAGSLSFVPFQTLDSSAYDAAADLWWSFRVAGSATLFFETAASGAGPWRARGTVVMPDPPAAARIWFGHGRYSGNAACESRFDCANLPTCP